MNDRDRINSNHKGTTNTETTTNTNAGTFAKRGATIHFCECNGGECQFRNNKGYTITDQQAKTTNQKKNRELSYYNHTITCVTSIGQWIYLSLS